MEYEINLKETIFADSFLRGWFFVYFIGNCSKSSVTPAKKSEGFLVGQNAGFALFYFIGNCSESSVTPAKKSEGFLVGQNAGFALFYRKLPIA